jgi:hypothetical protein
MDVERERPEHIVALSGQSDGAAGYVNRLIESFDDGKTWAWLGSPLSGGPIAETLEFASPTRLYLSALDSSYATIARSDDSGNTWTHWRISQEPDLLPFIAAVDPADPDRVYVRAKARGIDRLFVSADAGVSWTQIYQSAGGVLGFALSPDGSTVAVGGPGAGVNLASTDSFAFHRVSDVQPYCLRWTRAGLYACATEATDGFTVGLSVDGGAHFQSLFHLPDLMPLACPAATAVGSSCGRDWPIVASAIGADAPLSPASDSRAPAKSSSCEVGIRQRSAFELVPLALVASWILWRRRSSAVRPA